MVVVLLILVFLALGVVFARRKSHPEQARLLLPVLAVLAMILSVGNALRGGSQQRIVHLATDYAEAQGFVLGEALAASVPKGSQVLVLQWNARLEPYRSVAESELRGVRAGSRKADLDLVQIGANPFDSPTGDEDSVSSLATFGIPVEMMAGWIEANPDADAVVSFCDLNKKVLAYPPDRMPSLFYVAHEDPSEFHLRAVEAGRAAGVVLLKPGSDWREMPPKGDARDVFDVRYLLLTPNNVDEIRSFKG